MSSIHFRILGFQGPTSSIPFRIQGSQGPTSGIHSRILGSQGPMTRINFRNQSPQGPITNQGLIGLNRALQDESGAPRREFKFKFIFVNEFGPCQKNSAPKSGNLVLRVHWTRTWVPSPGWQVPKTSKSCYQGCGAVTFLVGSGSGSGAAFRLRLRLRGSIPAPAPAPAPSKTVRRLRLRLRLRLRVKLFGGSGQNVPAPAAPAPAPAPMIKSSYEPKPAIRFSKMPNVKI